MQNSIGNSLFTKQLESNTTLYCEQYYDIAQLIYETDPYIYPAMFDDVGGKETAVRILSRLLRSGRDSLFCLDSIFACFDEEKIIGIILWKNDSANWDEDQLIKKASEEGVTLNRENIQIVKDEYFNEKYRTEKNKTTVLEILNVCVKEDYRGKGIGYYLLESFISNHIDEEMELNVLTSNMQAVKLYRSIGFEIRKEYEGFSIRDEKPICYEMVRHI